MKENHTVKGVYPYDVTKKGMAKTYVDSLCCFGHIYYSTSFYPFCLCSALWVLISLFRVSICYNMWIVYQCCSVILLGDVERMCEEVKKRISIIDGKFRTKETKKEAW